jgi:hypothetical protein
MTKNVIEVEDIPGVSSNIETTVFEWDLSI